MPDEKKTDTKPKDAESEKDPKDMTPQELSAKGAAAPPKGPSVVVVVHGSYTGPGCPDKHKRKRSEDNGFNYDHDHPAVIGEKIHGLGDHEVKRMLASKCFKKPEHVQPVEDEAAA